MVAASGIPGVEGPLVINGGPSVRQSGRHATTDGILACYGPSSRVRNDESSSSATERNGAESSSSATERNATESSSSATERNATDGKDPLVMDARLHVQQRTEKTSKWNGHPKPEDDKGQRRTIGWSLFTNLHRVNLLPFQ